jgi:hypothetical protein
MTPTTSASPLFQSARSAGNLSLVAFAGALLAAFAIHAGAFLPRLSAPRAAQQVELAAQPAAPAVVAGARLPASPRT